MTGNMAGNIKIILRPSEEMTPRELEFILCINDDSGEIEVVPGGFGTLAVSLATPDGLNVKIKQETDGLKNIILYNYGRKNITVKGKKINENASIIIDQDEDAVLTAKAYDVEGAAVYRFFTGEAFRISGFLQRGRMPYDSEVEVIFDGRAQVVYTKDGRFDAHFVCPGTSETADRTIVVHAAGASVSFDIQIIKNELLIWRQKALESYAPCILCNPDLKCLAEILSMELSLLMSMNIPIIMYENMDKALILKPSCENTRGAPQKYAFIKNGDIVIAGDKNEITEKVRNVLDELKLYWKHVPLITTDEWKIKSTRYPMVFASRHFSVPEGKFSVTIRSEADAFINVCGLISGPLNSAVFNVDLSLISDKHEQETDDLNISIRQALPAVKHLVISCGGKSNKYSINILMPSNLRVIDPTIKPLQGLTDWRGGTQTLNVTRDSDTLRQKIELIICIEEGQPECIALGIISMVK